MTLTWIVTGWKQYPRSRASLGFWGVGCPYTRRPKSSTLNPKECSGILVSSSGFGGLVSLVCRTHWGHLGKASG